MIKNFVNNPDFKDPGSGHDPILGQSEKADRERFFFLKDKDGKKHKVDLKKDFVIPTGGGYFFSPSIRALKDLSDSKD